MSTKYSNLYGNNPNPIEGRTIPEEEEDECQVQKDIKRIMRDTREQVKEEGEVMTFESLRDLLKVVMHSTTRKLKRKTKP